MAPLSPVDAVVAEAAVDDVVSSASGVACEVEDVAPDEVAAVAGVDLVVIEPTLDLVVSSETADPVVSTLAVDRVGTVRADDDVVGVCADDRSRARDGCLFPEARWCAASAGTSRAKRSRHTGERQQRDKHPPHLHPSFACVLSIRSDSSTRSNGHAGLLARRPDIGLAAFEQAKDRLVGGNEDRTQELDVNRPGGEAGRCCL